MTEEQSQAPWRRGWRDGEDSMFAGRSRREDDEPSYRTLTYEVSGRIARITFNRPERGNAITADTPVELAAVVERADLDPRVHVMVISGRGKGFCGGYDLGIFAEGGGDGFAEGGGDGFAEGGWDGFAEGGWDGEARATQEPPGPGRRGAPDPRGTVLDPAVQARNHVPGATWDPMIDYAMMSRFNRGFSSLLYANKPTVAKLHGFCVAGGTDIALYADQIICADNTKIGYPPTRVWGVPAAGMWAHRLGDARAKRLLLTGDCLSGEQAARWGLAVEAPPPDLLDERTEDLLARIARMPINQLMMVKLALNSALIAQGAANSTMISTVFDGIARHTREGYAFQQRAATVGFREAVRERDEPFADHKRDRAGEGPAGGGIRGAWSG